MIYILPMDIGKDLSSIKGFQWDDHNILKNWEKHRISNWECEEVFFNEPIVIRSDLKHSHNEDRYYALGHTDAGLRLFVVFTVRKGLMRPITFRKMTKSESRIYDEYQ